MFLQRLCISHWFRGFVNICSSFSLKISSCPGMDKTIQRGDLGHHGVLFKIVPKHSDSRPSDHNFIGCWYKPLSKWLPRAGQSVIPTNLTEFKVKSLYLSQWLRLDARLSLVHDQGSWESTPCSREFAKIFMLPENCVFSPILQNNLSDKLSCAKYQCIRVLQCWDIRFF